MKLTYEQVCKLKKGDLIQVFKEGILLSGEIHSIEVTSVPAVFIQQENGNIERFNTGINFVKETWQKYCNCNIEFQITQTEQFSIFDWGKN